MRVFMLKKEKRKKKNKKNKKKQKNTRGEDIEILNCKIKEKFIR